MSNNYNLVIGNQNWHRAAASFVRMSVFVLERGLAIDDEFDDLDVDGTMYVLLFDGTLPIATGRFLVANETTAKFTRIATLKQYRGQHLGSQIIVGLEKIAQQQGLKQAIIHSELTAKGFYESLGYKPISEIYMEDDVACQTLQKIF